MMRQAKNREEVIRHLENGGVVLAIDSESLRGAWGRATETKALGDGVTVYQQKDPHLAEELVNMLQFQNATFGLSIWLATPMVR